MKQMVTDRIPNTLIAAHGIARGRRIRDEEGKLWVVVKVRKTDNFSDTSMLTRVPWTPLHRHGPDPRPSARVTRLRRG